MRITPQIKEAIEKAIKEFGNINRLALQIGIPQHYIVRWLNGRTQSMGDIYFDMLYPFIQKYWIPNQPGAREIDVEIANLYISEMNNRSVDKPSDKEWKKPESAKTAKPLITKSQILEEAARFVRELTGKYDLYADDLSRIVKALSSVTDIESKE